MNVGLNKKYFIIVSGRESFECALAKENMELHLCEGAKKLYKSNIDGSIWVSRFDDYDYIHEFSGIMRLPELEFSELWNLLLFSKFKNNRIGAILLIEEMYGHKLMEMLEEINKNNRLTREQKSLLKLIKDYSLPNGAFHWRKNKDIDEYAKRNIILTWDRITEIINILLNKPKFKGHFF